MDLDAKVGLTAVLHRATNEANEAQVHESLNSASGNGPLLPSRRRPVARTAKQAKSTPFARPANYPSIRTAQEADGVDAALASHTIVEVDFFEILPEGADDSLDRRLPPMPSLEDFSRVNINTMTELGGLGEGGSGQVRLMLSENRKVAVKRSTCTNSARARKRLEKEATVHERIDSCINVVRLLGRAVETDDSGEDHIVGIITEWCPLGDLFTAIKDAAWKRELDRDGEDISSMEASVGYQLYKDWTKRLEIVAGIAAGMVSMHNRQFVHRDLTSWNVLLKSTGNCGEYEINICDFERGYYLPDGQCIQRTGARANSAPWMGPEVLRNEYYGLKADVYSIGTILWELMFLENPWTHLKERTRQDKPNIQSLLALGTISLSFSKEDASKDIPEFPALVKLVKRVWAPDPENRPTMGEFHKEVMEICNSMKERVSAERNEI